MSIPPFDRYFYVQELGSKLFGREVENPVCLRSSGEMLQISLHSECAASGVRVVHPFMQSEFKDKVRTFTATITVVVPRGASIVHEKLNRI